MGSYRVHYRENGRETQRLVDASSRQEAIEHLLAEMPQLRREDVLRVVFVPG